MQRVLRLVLQNRRRGVMQFRSGRLGVIEAGGFVGRLGQRRMLGSGFVGLGGQADGGGNGDGGRGGKEDSLGSGKEGDEKDSGEISDKENMKERGMESKTESNKDSNKENGKERDMDSKEDSDKDNNKDIGKDSDRENGNERNMDSNKDSNNATTDATHSLGSSRLAVIPGDQHAHPGHGTALTARPGHVTALTAHPGTTYYSTYIDTNDVTKKPASILQAILFGVPDPDKYSYIEALVAYFGSGGKPALVSTASSKVVVKGDPGSTDGALVVESVVVAEVVTVAKVSTSQEEHAADGDASEATVVAEKSTKVDETKD